MTPHELSLTFRSKRLLQIRLGSRGGQEGEVGLLDLGISRTLQPPEQKGDVFTAWTCPHGPSNSPIISAIKPRGVVWGNGVSRIVRSPCELLGVSQLRTQQKCLCHAPGWLHHRSHNQDGCLGTGQPRCLLQIGLPQCQGVNRLLAFLLEAQIIGCLSFVWKLCFASCRRMEDSPLDPVTAPRSSAFTLPPAADSVWHSKGRWSLKTYPGLGPILTFLHSKYRCFFCVK